jgi:hypothetical protein
MVGVGMVRSCCAGRGRAAVVRDRRKRDDHIGVGGLAVSNISVTIVRQDPLELDLRVGVVDARGTR